MLQASGAGTSNGCRICLTATLPLASPAGAGVQLKSSKTETQIFSNAAFYLWLGDTQHYSGGSEFTKEEKVSMCDTIAKQLCMNILSANMLLSLKVPPLPNSNGTLQY